MKTKNFWINENGIEKKASYKSFKYYYNEFCSYVMDINGNIKDKGQVKIRQIELIYNSFGIAIAGRNF